MVENGRSVFKKLDLKRKFYARGKGNSKFKRFKKTPKYIRDNVENQIAREKEKDAYHFTDSEEDNADDLGMGLELSDLPFLFDNQDNQKELIALTQDSVKPFFANESELDEAKFQEGLLELKYSSFRPNQRETIKRILMGRSTLFISPTGSGKSLCYQLPALLYWRYRKYITIVVSPLISLMEDQMSNFPKALKAISLHSNHNITQRRKSIQQLVSGDAQVAFISPEAIVGGLLNLDDLKNLPPVGFVCIDEAHCLSEWSHNFRPAYLQFFKILHENMKIKTYLGLTATSTKATSFAISKNLIINPETDVIGSTKIPDNLILSVSVEVNKERALIKLLQSPTFRIMTSIIVYCNRREETERVASRIRTAMQAFATVVEVPERRKSSDSTDSSSSSEKKPQMTLAWNAEAYHAGLSSECRKRIQRQFIKGEIRVVVATIAFGMGINKSNIRAIIHYDMPSSFESYVQEIGRAGRDGKIAQCHMFLNSSKTDLYYQLRNIYSCVTERKYLKKLTEYVFKKCKCMAIRNVEEEEKLNKLNETDPHVIKSDHKTDFINKPQELDSDDSGDELEVLVGGKDDKQNTQKETSKGSPVKYVRESVVRKHRCCVGHEKTFDIEQSTEAINLKIESIITLICQLQRAFPQLQITQYTPVKSTCNLLCYNGLTQMEALAKSNPIVKYALNSHRRNQIKAFGTAGETPTKLTFDIIEVASAIGKTYMDAVKTLKKTEWVLVEKTGRFKRSQVRVSFEGNSFHIKAVGDLDEKETQEIDNFLFDFTKLYERIEREKITRVFNTFKVHSLDVDEMGDKQTRLKASSNLKSALNEYFDRNHIALSTMNERQNLTTPSMMEAIVSGNLTEVKIQAIRKDARQFIRNHKSLGEISPRAIGRIFQGISTPMFKAEVWGLNRRWWRIHVDVDFLDLVSIIQEELVASATELMIERTNETTNSANNPPTSNPANTSETSNNTSG